MTDAARRLVPPLLLALVLLVLAPIAGVGPAAHGQSGALSDDAASRAVAALEALGDAGLLREEARPAPGSDGAHEAASIIRDHGFTPEDWVAALHGVTDGYVALKAARLYETPGAEAEFEAMRQSIIDNPDIDDATRRQALEELDRRLGPQVAESPLAATVAPYEDRLDRVFDGGGGGDGGGVVVD